MAAARLKPFPPSHDFCIHCSSPSRINPAGQLEVVCFDKTGTLTTDRIDVVGFALVPKSGSPKDSAPAGISSDVGEERADACARSLGALMGVDEVGWHMVCCLALCHSLVPAPVRHKSCPVHNGLKTACSMEQGMPEGQEGAAAKYIGDPLEIATFAAVGASLEERMVQTSAGDSLRAPVVTLHGRQAATVLEAGRAEHLVLCAEAGMGGKIGLKNGTGEGGSDTDSGDALYVLDQVVGHGNLRQESGLGIACSEALGVDMLVEGVHANSEVEGWCEVSPVAAHAASGADGNGRGGRRGDSRGGKMEPVERAAVLRRFAFTSEALRSSVVVAFERVAGTYVYVKGAPEVLVGLCIPATLPPNIWQEVSHHTRNGRRVLACAFRTCGAAGAAWALEADRTDVESNLVWAGLLVMENTLKPDSKGAVDELVAAGLHCAMVTGDHSLTAISVARRCGILLPSLPVLLGKVIGEDGGAGAGVKGEDKYDGHRSEIERLVFAKVLPLSDDLGDANASPLAGASEELSAREAFELMVGEGANIGVSASPEGGKFEIAVTGAALDILLRLSEGSTSWCVTSNVPSAKKRRAWGPPGLSRNSRNTRKGGGRVQGVPTISPPSSPSFTPAVSHSPAPLSAMELRAGSHTVSEKEIARQIIRAARVFARCSPLHKQTLVTSLALNLPATVAFCGDGANDCGALKAAHVGLSLSDAESSIAAPFTSSTRSVRAMVDLIREGRAALVSSVAAFKFMALYSLTQLISVLRLYEVNATLTDGMFLWVDLFLVLPFVVTMAQTAAAPGLAWLRPQGRLVSPPVLASVFGQVLLVILFQVLAGEATHRMARFQCDPLCRPFGYNATAALGGNTTHTHIAYTAQADSSADTVSAQDATTPLDQVPLGVANSSDEWSGVCWNGTGPIAPCCLKQPLGCPTHAVHPSPKVNCVSVEATAAFILSQFQYLGAIVAFSSGPPYRQPAYTNMHLDINLAVAVSASLALALGVQGGDLLSFVVSKMRLVAFPDENFPGRLILLSVFAITAACSLESVISHVDDLLAGHQDDEDAAVAGIRVDFYTLMPSVSKAISHILQGRGGRSLWKVLTSLLMLVCSILFAILLVP